MNVDELFVGEKAILVTIIVLVLSILCIICACSNGEKYVYECKDLQGNIVYCTSYKIIKGNAWGITEDGTTISITSYKRILKSEVK